MINQVYQLITPKTISVKYTDIGFHDKVIVRPEYLALCHADQRYFLGRRDAKTLREKLPMALVHECCGRVIYDPKGIWKSGQSVVLIPNQPDHEDPVVAENYRSGSRFLSSGYDGFMQELVEIDRDRVLPFDKIDPVIAAITEFVSVGVHAISRFDAIAHARRTCIGVWGDGSLAYIVANLLHICYPQCKLVVIGHGKKKLSHFSFADHTYLSSEIPDDLHIDHAFECCGGEGSRQAIEDVIRYINPQGTLVLMGVSENHVAINTRMVLEKGMTLVGCSRSGKADFEQALIHLQNPELQDRLRVIIFEDAPVRSIKDIYRAFETDLTSPFKTVFRWDI